MVLINPRKIGILTHDFGKSTQWLCFKNKQQQKGNPESAHIPKFARVADKTDGGGGENTAAGAGCGAGGLFQLWLVDWPQLASWHPAGWH